MKKQIVNKSIFTLIIIFMSGLWVSCSSSHKVEQESTQLENATSLNANTQLGLKDEELVYQNKVDLNESVRKFENEVLQLEDRVYGTRQYGSYGLYGKLRTCEAQVQKKQGSSSKGIQDEEIIRLTDTNPSEKIVLDEKNQLKSVSEEYLKDRLARLKEHKTLLQKKEDKFNQRLVECEAQLKQKN